MYNQDENSTGKKSISSFKNDAVNGDGIIGGGKGSFILPNETEEAAGINNSGMPNSVDDGTTTTSDDGTIQVIDNGIINIG